MFLVSANDLVALTNDCIAKTRKMIETTAHEQSVELRTREEVIKQLNVAPSTLWRWKQSGYLVPINVGGQYRYKSTDINEILEGKR